MDRKMTQFETFVLEKKNAHCRDVAVLLFEYTEGEISAQLAKKLQGHITTCSTCQDLVSSYKLVIDIAKEIGAGARPRLTDEARKRFREGLAQRLGI